jgi:pimeloyl-ACP methyl ester carboxylesterase
MASAAATFVAMVASAPVVQAGETITVRGHQQFLRLYGDRTGTPVIVSSGDGGWIHLAPHVAALLASQGFFVVGFDARAYLQSFTSGQTTLRPEDEPGDYETLIEFATRQTGKKPVLIGVSEGAGLSVLAATDPRTKHKIGGVVGLGLPDSNELGWHWKDSLIYITHGMPNEPAFSTAAIVSRMAPVPLAVIHSTRDEYVPVEEVERVVAAARDPKKIWIVKSSNHRFSDAVAELDRRVLEALAWIGEHAPR